MWVHNINCQRARYLDTWANSDPGILSIVPAILKMPLETIAAAFNIDTSTANVSQTIFKALAALEPEGADVEVIRNFKDGWIGGLLRAENYQVRSETLEPLGIFLCYFRESHLYSFKQICVYSITKFDGVLQNFLNLNKSLQSRAEGEMTIASSWPGPLLRAGSPRTDA